MGYCRKPEKGEKYYRFGCYSGVYTVEDDIWSENGTDYLYYDANAVYKLEDKAIEAIYEREWKPKKGERYYYPFTLCGKAEVSATDWRGNKVDQQRYAVGLVFKSREDAYRLAKRLIFESERRRKYFNECGDKPVKIVRKDNKSCLRGL